MTYVDIYKYPRDWNVSKRGKRSDRSNNKNTTKGLTRLALKHVYNPNQVFLVVIA